MGAATAPPTLGEHTDELLADWLGLPKDRLQAMRAAGEIA
jgi:crotonobetainyl-CoA:carnitine CoA-transferase CaiB-like acyl-CoA transferase